MPHQKYEVAGVEYPSVTTILNVVAKPFLIKWANRLGKEGIDYEEYLKNAANTGTLTHLFIENYINKKNGTDLNNYNKKQLDLANKLFENFKGWYSKQQRNPIFTELSMVSERLGFGGTCDFVFEDNNNFCLVDFKTTTHIQREYFIQLLAYSLLLKEKKGIIVDTLSILRLTEEGYEYQEMKITEAKDKYYEYFMACKTLYEIKKKVFE